MGAFLQILSALVTIIGFVAFSSWDINNLSWWQRSALLLIFFVMAGYLVHSALERRRRRRETFRGDAKFHAFMAEWVAQDGDTVIVSDTFSWSVDERVRAASKAKARAGQLTLIMRAATDFSRELEADGAKVFYYQDQSLVPKSRFTVVSADTPHRRVAVGWPGGSNKQRHVHVYEEGRDPFVGAAMDLVKALRGEQKAASD